MATSLTRRAESRSQTPTWKPSASRCRSQKTQTYKNIKKTYKNRCKYKRNKNIQKQVQIQKKHKHIKTGANTKETQTYKNTAGAKIKETQTDKNIAGAKAKETQTDKNTAGANTKETQTDKNIKNE